MKHLTISIFAGLALYVSASHGQEKLSSHPMSFMNEQLSMQLLNDTQALSDPKLIKAQAQLLRKHYEALIETGFTKEQAMKIIIAMASRDGS